ncbi:MAG: hypothetical protein GF310_10725 [candidate division Zixibacteria bacterium]|nr:hypothetical protein [candidate division Zixibacteria bacterium]
MRADRLSLKKILLPVTMLAITAMLLPGCSLESPKAPTWDADLAIPLISRHYDMYELIDRMAEDAISYDSLGNLSVSFEQHMDTVLIDAGLSAEDVSEDFQHQLGAVTITPPAAKSVQLELTDYVSLATLEVPDVGFDADKDFDQISEFESATFAEGQLIISITNYFGVELDSLTIWIVNNQTSDTIAEYFFESGLGIGESTVDTTELAGRTASDDIGLESRIHTPGGTLLSTSDKYLDVELRFGDGVTVSSAVAQVSAQNKDYSSTIEFNEEHELTSAALSGGQLSITVQNSSPLGADISLEFPEITSSGIPLSIDGSISGSGQASFNRNITGYILEPEITEQTMTVNVNLNAYLPGSGGVAVEISSDDQFSVQADLAGLEFSQATGIIAPTEIEIDPVQENLDLPKGFDEVSLTDAMIFLDVYSEVSIPTSVNIELTGDGGQYLSFEADLESGTPQNPGVTNLVITDLGTLTNPIPNEIVITGIATAGDGSTPGTVYPDSKVWGDVEITSPLKFAIGETVIDGDINSTEIEQDDIDEVSERLLAGDIYATITNHLPFGAEVELYLGGDSTVLYSSPQLTIGPIEVGAGVVDAAGLVTEAIESDVVIHLSEEDLDIIENATLYIGQKITLPGTNGQAVNIINTDYLDIEAHIELNTRLGGEWD